MIRLIHGPVISHIKKKDPSSRHDTKLEHQGFYRVKCTMKQVLNVTSTRLLLLMKKASTPKGLHRNIVKMSSISLTFCILNEFFQLSSAVDQLSCFWSQSLEGFWWQLPSSTSHIVIHGMSWRGNIRMRFQLGRLERFVYSLLELCAGHYKQTGWFEFAIMFIDCRKILRDRLHYSSNDSVYFLSLQARYDQSFTNVNQYLNCQSTSYFCTFNENSRQVDLRVYVMSIRTAWFQIIHNILKGFKIILAIRPLPKWDAIKSKNGKMRIYTTSDHMEFFTCRHKETINSISWKF